MKLFLPDVKSHFRTLTSMRQGIVYWRISLKNNTLKNSVIFFINSINLKKIILF